MFLKNMVRKIIQKSAAKSYNKTIKSFRDLVEINDDEAIIYE